MDIKKLLEIRKDIKSRKPKFIRQDFHKKSGLKKKWRKPKGLHSKLRLNIRGKVRSVSQGYRSPKKVRSLHKSGLEIKVIKSEKDLEGLDPKKYCLVISSNLGNKKKITLLKKIKDIRFKILNIKNPDNYIKKIEDQINAKTKAKKEEKKTSKEKAKKKEEKLSDKVSDEETKEIEKKKKDQMLSKRER